MKRFFFILTFVLSLSAAGFLAAGVSDDDVLINPAKTAMAKGYIGVQLREPTSVEFEKQGESGSLGVVVEKVLPDSPGAKAGLQAGDVITHYAGIPVLGVAQFQSLVGGTTPGRIVPLEVRRGAGAKVVVKVTVGERQPLEQRMFRYSAPESGARPRPFEFFGDEEGDGDMFLDFDPDDMVRDHMKVLRFRERPRLGIEIEGLSDQLAAFFQAPEGSVLVKKVLKDSPAEKAGLKAGDVILSVNGEALSGASSLSRAVRKAEGGDVVLSVSRNGKKLEMKATVEKEEKQAPPEKGKPVNL